MITGLTSGVNYDVYCYAVDTVGNGITFSNILETKTETRTSCCRDLYFVQLPSSVYQDSSMYSPGDFSYFFTFEVPVVPEQSITVTPIFLQRDSYGGIGDVMGKGSIQATPGSFTFDNTLLPSQMAGTFVIRADADLYFVELVVSGPSAVSYGPFTGPFTVISNSEPPSPPKLKSAVFDSSGAFAFVEFDSASDRGVEYSAIMPIGEFTCYDLLEFPGSPSAKCMWLSDTQLKIFFGNIDPNIALITPGELILLWKDRLKPLCKPGTTAYVCGQYIFNDYSGVYIETPSDAVSPIPSLKTPALLSACDDLKVDASSSTGDGGRPWANIEWSLLKTKDDDTDDFEIVDDRGLNEYFQQLAILNFPFKVAGSLLDPDQYTVKLTLTNFFGIRASISTQFEKTTNGDIPSVSYLGSTFILMKSIDPLSVTAVGVPSSCATDKQLHYKYTLYRSFVFDNKQSTSVNPRNFKLPGYTLDTGFAYQLYVEVATNSGSTASAVLEIFVESNILKPSVYGGYSRFIPEDQSLVLDGSESMDLNFQTPEEATFTFVWNCNYLTPSLYGMSCVSQLPGIDFNSAVLTIPPLKLFSTDTYQFELTIVAPDGRTESVAVQVQPIAAGSPSVTITSDVSIINADQVLILNGNIQGSSEMSIFWECLDASIDIENRALTAVSRTIPEEVADSVNFFPLSVSSGTFVPGRLYTFRLVAYPTGRLDRLASGEVSISINAPPSSGILTVVPGEGFALSTAFDLIASGWIDDLASYPFLYSFQFALTLTDGRLAIGANTFTSYVSSQLPSGLQSEQYIVYCFNSATDVFGAASSVSSQVNVQIDNSVDPTEQAEAALGGLDEIDPTDASGMVSTINNVASVLGIVDCTSAPACGVLNRLGCASKANNCGPCMDGFIGIFGPSNTPCRMITSPASDLAKRAFSLQSEDGVVGTIGSPCLEHADCLYFNCYEGTCESPSKQCPSAAGDVISLSALAAPASVGGTASSLAEQFASFICSGHGSCEFLDLSGRNTSTCFVNETSCYPQCSCNEGWGGADCSLDAEKLEKKRKSRVKMCWGLINATSASDPSLELIGTLTNSLLSSFDPNEMTDAHSIEICSLALTQLSVFVDEGLLAGSDISVAVNIANLISKFGDVKKPQLDESVTSAPTSAPTYSSEKHGNAMMSSLTSLQGGVSENMIGGQKPADLVSDNMKMQIRRDRMEDLNGGSLAPPAGAADLQYGNPQPGLALPPSGLQACGSNDGFAQASIMKWGKNPFDNSSDVESSVMRFATASAGTERRRLQAVSYNANGMPLDAFGNIIGGGSYFVTLQFSKPQSLNETKDGVNTQKVPECQIRSGDGYKSCGICDVANVTEYNATFECYEPSVLCGTSDDGEGLTTEERRRLHEHGRRLSEGGGANDYAAMMEAILAEIAATLTSNPFAMNLEEGKNAIFLTASLFFAFVGGMVYFGRWDKHDVAKKKYISGDDHVKMPSDDENADKSEVFPHGEHNLYGKDDSEDESKDVHKKHESFLSTVVPADSVLTDENSLMLFMKKIIREHDFLAMISYPSTVFPRKIRFFGLFMDIMITLFTDTLFFGLQFPSGVCEPLTPLGEEACLMVKPVFPFGNPTQCEYDEDDGCMLLDPPETVTFGAMLTLIVLILGLPLSLALWYVYMTVLVKKPDFSQSWIGVTKRSVKTSTTSDNELSEEEVKALEIDDELNKMIISATDLIQNDLENTDSKWKTSGAPKHFERASATAEALGAHADGTPMSLGFWQWLLYGSRSKYLASKIAKAVDSADSILEELDSFEEEDEHLKDVFIMQHFVLEQFTPIKRLVLQNELFKFDNLKPQKVHYLTWLVSWGVCQGVFGFFLYWIFAWGVRNSGEIMDLWGEAFGLAVIQDLFVCIPLKLFIIHGLMLKSLRPQLKQVYHTLANVAATKMQDEPSSNRDESQVVQHVSGACRAAAQVPDLPAAALLMSMDDSDYINCRRSRNSKVGTIAFILIMIPVTFALLGETLGEFAMETFIPTLWCGFLIGNDMLLQISWLLLAAVYLGFLFYLYILYKIIKPRRLSKRSNSLLHAKNHRHSIKLKKKKSYLTLFSAEVRVAFKNIYKDWFYPAMHEKKERMWMNMNRSFFLQSRVLTAHDLRQTLKRESYAGYRTKNIPNKIYELLHQGTAWKLQDVEAHHKLRKYQREFNDDYSFDIIDQKVDFKIPLDLTGYSHETAALPVTFEILSFDIMKKSERNLPDDVMSDDSIEPMDDIDFIDNPSLLGTLTPDCVEFEVLTFDIKKKGYNVTTNHDISSSFSDKHVSTKITHVGPKGKRHVIKDQIKDQDDDKFVQTFLSSKFVGDEGKVTQFEAITAGPDLVFGDELKRRKTSSKHDENDDYYLANDLMLEWQLSPVPELIEKGVDFEILTFDVKRMKKDKENDDYDMTNPKKVIDQKVVSQIQLVENDSNMITDVESGMIFEMLSFDLNAKQVLITEDDDE